MKTSDVIHTPEYDLFIDLDGVLVNFKKKAYELTGIDIDNADKAQRNDFWKKIGAHMKQGGKFFEEMEQHADAMHLWNYVKPKGARILSATGHLRGAAQEKGNWVRAHLGGHAASQAIFVRDGVDKAQYAHENAILIDDREKVITPWVEAGGIGILHTNSARTINELKKLGV